MSYTLGNDLSGSFEGAGGIGGLLGRSHGYSSGSWSGHNFYHADGNGNVTMLIDNAGTPNVTATYRYDPYGNSITATGTNAANNVYRFSSKEFHVNSGMYYYGYRFYDPNLQRWLNRDPISELGFETLPRRGWGKNDDLNLYDYVHNSPISYQDPYGLSLWSRIKDFFKDLCHGGKEAAKDKAKDVITDKAKELFAEIFGGDIEEAKGACEAIKSEGPDSMPPGIWEMTCQQCAAFKCAMASATIVAAKNCLENKFARCAGGKLP